MIQYWLNSECFGPGKRVEALGSYFSSATIQHLGGAVALADPINACDPLADPNLYRGRVSACAPLPVCFFCSRFQ